MSLSNALLQHLVSFIVPTEKDIGTNPFWSLRMCKQHIALRTFNILEDCYQIISDVIVRDV